VLTTPESDTKPLEPVEGVPAITLENPPGLYGGEEGVYALNLLTPGTTLMPIEQPNAAVPVTVVNGSVYTG
jgi:hypothetical protein